MRDLWVIARPTAREISYPANPELHPHSGFAPALRDYFSAKGVGGNSYPVVCDKLTD
jgi:hypothetical protein